MITSFGNWDAFLQRTSRRLIVSKPTRRPVIDHTSPEDVIKGVRVQTIHVSAPSSAKGPTYPTLRALFLLPLHGLLRRDPGRGFPAKGHLFMVAERAGEVVKVRVIPRIESERNVSKQAGNQARLVRHYGMKAKASDEKGKLQEHLKLHSAKELPAEMYTECGGNHEPLPIQGASQKTSLPHSRQRDHASSHHI
ncbi:hypothetical protein F4780DRAFT_297669 [Xylariomycetidae sp. FL0641]|nr:hypothetical protein F4780DRAFT_297669 [Xylariomycetidae sp. FL0641]